MQRWIYSITTATVLIALSTSAQASADPGAAQDLLASKPGAPTAALTVGETMLLAQAKQSKEKEKSGKSKTQAQKAQGYEKSGNPKAAGGPQNPGKKKSKKTSDARPEQPIAGVKPEQPIAGVKPEQPIEKPKPEQPIEKPKPEPRDKGGTG